MRTVLLLATGCFFAACGGKVSGTGSGDGSSGATSGSSGGANTSGSATQSSGSAGASSGATSALGPKCGSNLTQLVGFSTLAQKLDATGLSAGRLAVDANNVYFVFSNSLQSVPIRGGATTTMLRAPQGGSLEAVPIVTPTTVIVHYATSGTDEQIVSVPIGGGSPKTLATSNGAIVGFAVSGNNAYFFDQGGVKSVSVAGGSVRVLTSDAKPDAYAAGGIAVVGSNVIVAQTDEGTVLSVPLSGGAPKTLATKQTNPEFPMACGSDTCWWSGMWPMGVAGSQGPASIVRIDANGALTSISGALALPWDVMFDGTDFFETVACDVCDGTLLRISAAGKPVVMMGSGTYAAVDDTCVYWSTHEGVFSVVKSYTPLPML